MLPAEFGILCACWQDQRIAGEARFRARRRSLQDAGCGSKLRAVLLDHCAHLRDPCFRQAVLDLALCVLKFRSKERQQIGARNKQRDGICQEGNNNTIIAGICGRMCCADVFGLLGSNLRKEPLEVVDIVRERHPRE